jgi:hypothetical protein
VAFHLTHPLSILAYTSICVVCKFRGIEFPAKRIVPFLKLPMSRGSSYSSGWYFSPIRLGSTAREYSDQVLPLFWLRGGRWTISCCGGFKNKTRLASSRWESRRDLRSRESSFPMWQGSGRYPDARRDSISDAITTMDRHHHSPTFGTPAE